MKRASVCACRRPRPCVHAPPQPRLSASTAGRGLVGSELSPLGTAQCHSCRGPHGGVSSLWQGSRHGEGTSARGGAWSGAEAWCERWRPPGARRSCFIWARCPCRCVVHPAQPASLLRQSVHPSAQATVGRRTDGRAPVQGPRPGRLAPGSLQATSMGSVALAESVRREGRRKI